MLPQTLSAMLADLLNQLGELAALSPWLAIAGFGAYHGLNPGMGWLFALSLGLQQGSSRAIWRALLPITLGHAASMGTVAAIVLAGARFVPLAGLQVLMAMVLIGFGAYKVVNYQRHPRWVGMKVNAADLTWWSFLMATAHGAGLMVAPVLVGIAGAHAAQGHPAEAEFALGIGVHMLAMLAVMAITAWIVYEKVGLAVLRSKWLNFDLLWALALLVVGGMALLGALAPAIAQAGTIQHLGH